MKSVYFIILLTFACSIKLKKKDYLVNNDEIKDKFLSILGDMNSVLEKTVKLMKDNSEKMGIKFDNEKSEKIAEQLNEKVQEQVKEQKQTQQQKKDQKEEKPEQEVKVGQQQLVDEDNESLEDYELNNEGVDDSEVDAFQMVDDNEGIAQEPDIEF
jgi:hypothetical protein